MKRSVSVPILVGLVVVFGTSLAQAQEDKVILKGTKGAKAKIMQGIIDGESAQGIKLKGAKNLIPSANIADVIYVVTPLSLRLNSYRPACDTEEKAMTAKTDAARLKELGEAVAKYQETLAKLDEKQPWVSRHLEYKIGYLYSLKADIDGKDDSRILAIAKLKEFKTKHPGGWQTPAALTTLARLQVQQNDYEGAEATLTALVKAPVAEDVKEAAELQIAQLSLKAGRYAEAQQKLQAFAAKLPDSPAGLRAQLGAAECMVGLKNYGAAENALRKFLDDTKDADLKASAYNSLGYAYLKDGKLPEAQWAFLWVDVVYNQDRAEHARALYYLAQVFAQLPGQGERAEACLESLLNDGQYAGLEYQRKAEKEREKEKSQ